MGLTKTSLYTASQNELASLAKALAHPARIAILQHLLKTPQCITGDIVEEIGLAQATISQHLKELKSTGIIQGTIEGTSVCYCIDDQRWKEIQQLLQDFFQSYQEGMECC